MPQDAGGRGTGKAAGGREGQEKKEKEKEPFEARQPAVMPSGRDLAGLCKPGHWISQVWPDVKANRGDFQGELQTEIVDRTIARCRWLRSLTK